MYPFIAKIDNNNFGKFIENSSSSYRLSQREQWKFSGLKKATFSSDIFPVKKQKDTIKAASKSSYQQDGFSLFFINGNLDREVSDIDILLAEKIEIEIEKKQSEFILDEKENLFQNLNSFYSCDEVQINIPANTTLSKPIIFYYFYQKENIVYSPKISINIEENSKIEMIEISDDSSYKESFINKFLSINLDKNVKLSHLIFDCGKEFDVSNYFAQLMEFSEYKIFLYQAGSVNNISNFKIDLLKNQSSLDADGIFFSDSKNIQNIFFDIRHLEKNTYSNQNFKGIVKDEAVGSFFGKVTIAKNSSESRSSQLNKNLLLGEYAKTYSRPQLEINNDDVKCSHGSTSSSFNPLEIFYLQSRGLNLVDAQKMLLNAFANETILKSNNDTFSEFILDNLKDKF